MSQVIVSQRFEGMPRIAEYFQIPNASPLRSVDTEIRREWRQFVHGRPQEWVLSHRTAGYTPAGSCLRLQENDVYRVTCFGASEGVTRGQAFLTLEKAEEYLASRGEFLGNGVPA